MGIVKAFLASFNMKEFVGSKKAKAATLTIMGVIAGWCSIEIPKEYELQAAGAVLAVIGLVVSMYLHAQGKADQGKGAEQAKANGNSAQ